MDYMPVVLFGGPHHSRSLTVLAGVNAIDVPRPKEAGLITPDDPQGVMPCYPRPDRYTRRQFNRPAWDAPREVFAFDELDDELVAWCYWPHDYPELHHRRREAEDLFGR